MEETYRILRHLAPVVVTWLVAKGYVPSEVAGPLIELAAIVFVAGASLWASKARDVKRVRK